MAFKSYIGYNFGEPEVFYGGAQSRSKDDTPPLGGKFSGTLYLYGKKYENLNSTNAPYIRVVLTPNYSVSESNGPLPNPWPANEIWREKSKCVGDIYID